MGRRAKDARRVIRVRGLVPIPITPLRLFLSDVRNQILLAEDAVDLPCDLESVTLPTSVRLRAPRSLRIHVLLIALGEEHDALELLAAVGRRTELRIRWTLEEMQTVTGVELAVEFGRPTLPVRAFLLLGGARLLERRLEAALDSLGEIVRLAAAGGALDEAETCHIALTAHAVPRLRRPACIQPAGAR